MSDILKYVAQLERRLDIDEIKLAAVNYVSPGMMFIIIPAVVTAAVLNAVAASIYSSIDMGLTPKKLAPTLYVCAAAQALVGALLFARGVNKDRIFNLTLSQITLVGLASVPALLVTALWAVRVMLDATVFPAIHHHASDKEKVAFQLLTAAMVFSDIFAASVLSVVYTNTARFSTFENKHSYKEDA